MLDLLFRSAAYLNLALTTTDMVLIAKADLLAVAKFEYSSLFASWLVVHVSEQRTFFSAFG